MRLYLLRHAKSSWADDTLDDFDRPLDERGERAAAAMAVYCRQTSVAPDLVICSPARRTRQTWARLEAEIAPPREAMFPDAAYGADRATLCRLLRTAPPETGDILLIGHNPGLQDLAAGLASRPEDRVRLSAKLPTGALAIFEPSGADWAALDGGAAALIDFTTPKELL